MGVDIDGRARGGSDPGLPGWNDWPGLGRWLAGRAEARRTGAGLTRESRGAAAPLEADQAGARRGLTVARLAAGADDAEELARGLGADCAAVVRVAAGALPEGSAFRRSAWLAEFDNRAYRLARMAARCADQAVALRELADQVQTVAGDELPPGGCRVCGREGQPLDVTGRVCLGCATWAHYRGGAL